MKGGVWKNAEDEVLKAAVMKYGINNWSRVASLLVRKSARQCKARWYEWLDPSVKKTPWSKKEDEKLLNMAKLFPTQWKTIAPLVGRTSHQCLERYGQLLDIASGKDPNNLDEDDPRRLRPGEVDPNPETKLARADAVDLDDDEREMLAEARARLANTRGKKAKRKAREKQLQEARRVAVSQKRRELKAAGISVSAFRRGRRDGGIDYANEIPFEVKPLPGMHRVGAEETPNADANISNMRLQQLEESRQKATMLRLKIQDRRALKKLHDQDLPGMMRKNAEETDPFAIRKRTELTLPAPVVGDAELRDLTTAIDQANSLLDSTTDGNALSGLLQGAKGTRALLLGSSTVAAATTPLLSRGKSALTGGVTSTGGITATPKVAADGRSGRVTRKKERKGEITVASLLSGLPAALNEVTTDMSTADIEEADLEVDDDVEEDERDKEIKIKRRKQQLIEHLSHIHRRQEIFSEHLPRPLDLPHSMAEIQALLTVGDVTFEEQLIIQETAQLIYRDENEFLPAEEHLKVFSTPKSLLQSNFMPEAFLAFCGRAFKDVSMRHCLVRSQRSKLHTFSMWFSTTVPRHGGHNISYVADRGGLTRRRKCECR